MAAIYQWIENGVVYQVWTTTLYPIEAIEGLTFTVDLDISAMRAIPEDAMEHGPSEFISGSRIQILLETPIYEDAVEHAPSEFISGSKIQILLETPVYEDAVEHGPSELISASKLAILITAYHPANGLIFTVDLDTANCIMTPV